LRGGKLLVALLAQWANIIGLIMNHLGTLPNVMIARMVQRLCLWDLSILVHLMQFLLGLVCVAQECGKQGQQLVANVMMMNTSPLLETLHALAVRLERIPMALRKSASKTVDAILDIQGRMVVLLAPRVQPVHTKMFAVLHNARAALMVTDIMSSLLRKQIIIVNAMLAIMEGIPVVPHVQLERIKCEMLLPRQ
jgi:hypothetical protein